MLCGTLPHLVHDHCVRLWFVHELASWTEEWEDEDLSIGLQGDHLRQKGIRYKHLKVIVNLVSPERPLNPGKFLAKTTNLGSADAQTHIVDFQHLRQIQDYTWPSGKVGQRLTLMKPSSSATQNLGPNTLMWWLLPRVNWKSGNKEKSFFLSVFFFFVTEFWYIENWHLSWGVPSS